MSPKSIGTDEPYRTRIPADINEPDRIAFGLTFRQLALIGGVGVTGFGLHRALGGLLPPLVWLAAGIVVGAVTIVIALGRRDGLPLDVWLRHGLTLDRSAHTFAPGQPRASAVAVVAGRPAVPAPLRSPVTAVSPAGLLTSEGSDKVLISCGTTNIHLRTGEEQNALLDGFGRFLNALTRPAQIVVAAQRHDLAPYAQAVADNAPRLPHPALRAAAGGYAQFLLELDAERDPLRRQVLIVVTGAHSADSAVRTLSGLGVEATALDGPSVTAALTTAVDPFSPVVPGARAVPGNPITVRSSS